MTAVTQYYRTEGYILPSVKPGHMCMTFWMLIQNTDGTFDILRKDFYPVCRLRYPVATGLSESEAVMKIRQLQKEAEAKGRKVDEKSACYQKLKKDDYFAESDPLMKFPPYRAVMRQEMLKRKIKPNFKF